MITVRLTGIHLAIGLRLETSLWDYLDRLLEVTKIYNSRETYFFTVAWGGGGWWCLWFNSPILM